MSCLPKNRHTSKGSLLLASICVVIGFSNACQKAPKPEPLEIAVPKDFLRNIDYSEKVAGEVKKLVVKSLLRGIKTSDEALLGGAFSPDFSGSFPTRSELKLRPEGSVYGVSVPASKTSVSKQAFIRSVISFSSHLTQVERANWRVFHSYVAADRLSTVQDVHFQIAGYKSHGDSGRELRQELSGDVRLEAIRSKVGSDWLIKRISWRGGQFVESQATAFRDISSVVGLRLHDSQQNQKNVQRMIDIRRLNTVGGLTVFDYDKDGYDDILATRFYKDARLFINDRVGGFVPKKIAAIDEENASAKFYLAVDLDNDGDEELVSTHVFAIQEKPEASLYELKKGEFRRKKGALTFSLKTITKPNYESIIACDVNQDQLLDLVFLGYDHAKSGFENFNSINGTDGLRNLLFINQGNLRFKEEGETRGLTKTQYSYVSECYDFDQDGDLDLFIGNDYGQNNYYVNNGKGQFAEDNTHPLHKGRGFSMGFSMADYDNTGAYSISISNMYSHAGNRIIPLVDDLEPQTKELLQAFAAGNTLFELEEGQWRDKSEEKKVALAEWAWGNIFFDYDNDGDKDLYVANGFTSHEDADAPDF